MQGLDNVIILAYLFVIYEYLSANIGRHVGRIIRQLKYGEAFALADKIALYLLRFFFKFQFCVLSAYECN